jgi:hypothetical protein
LGILLTPDTLLGLRHATGTTATGAATTSTDDTSVGAAGTDEGGTGPDEGGSGASATGPPRSEPGTVEAGGADDANGSTSGDPPRRAPDALECAGVPPAPDLPWSNWADRLPASVAQRLACDCEVWRIVLDPTTGLPLEIGRAHRIVPPWIRKALHARDRGCRWPGCTAPASWCEVHHLLAWYFDGVSNVENLLMLCRWHHGRVHHDRPDDQRWSIHLDPANGEVTVYRPGGQPYELGPSQPYRPSTDTGPATPDDGRLTRDANDERSGGHQAPG